MATTPLTQLQLDELALHVADLADGEKTACIVANDLIALYEQFAWNRPGGVTGVNVCSAAPEGEGFTLITPEKTALIGQVNAFAAVEGPDGVAADVANEMLELYEERIQQLAPPLRGQRDVRIAQTHPFVPTPPGP